MGPICPEIPSCDGRRSSNAEDLKPPVPPNFPALERLMGEVVQFIPKSELVRARLIREARAMYESIFPTAIPVGEQRDPKQ